MNEKSGETWPHGNAAWGGGGGVVNRGIPVSLLIERRVCGGRTPEVNRPHAASGLTRLAQTIIPPSFGDGADGRLPGD